MLKTNSKKAAENIRAYIVDGFTPEGYTDNPPPHLPGKKKPPTPEWEIGSSVKVADPRRKVAKSFGRKS